MINSSKEKIKINSVKEFIRILQIPNNNISIKNIEYSDQIFLEFSKTEFFAFFFIEKNTNFYDLIDDFISKNKLQLFKDMLSNLSSQNLNILFNNLLDIVQNNRWINPPFIKSLIKFITRTYPYVYQDSDNFNDFFKIFKYSSDIILDIFEDQDKPFLFHLISEEGYDLLYSLLVHTSGFISFFKDYIQKYPEIVLWPSFLYDYNIHNTLYILDTIKEKFEISIPLKTLIKKYGINRIASSTLVEYFITNFEEYKEVLNEDYPFINIIKSDINVASLAFKKIPEKIKKLFTLDDYCDLCCPPQFINDILPYLKNDPYLIYQIINEMENRNKELGMSNFLRKILWDFHNENSLSLNEDQLFYLLENPNININEKKYWIDQFENLNDPSLDSYILFFYENKKIDPKIFEYFIENHKFNENLNNENERLILDYGLEDSQNQNIKRATINKIKELILEKDNIQDYQRFLLESALKEEKELNNQKLSFKLIRLGKLILSNKLIIDSIQDFKSHFKSVEDLFTSYIQNELILTQDFVNSKLIINHIIDSYLDSKHTRFFINQYYESVDFNDFKTLINKLPNILKLAIYENYFYLNKNPLFIPLIISSFIDALKEDKTLNKSDIICSSILKIFRMDLDEDQISRLKNIPIDQKISILETIKETRPHYILDVLTNKEGKQRFNFISFFEDIIKEIPELIINKKNISSTYDLIIFLNFLKDEFNIFLSFKKLINIFKVYIGFSHLSIIEFFIDNLNKYPELLESKNKDLPPFLFKTSILQDIYMFNLFHQKYPQIAKRFFEIKDYLYFIKMHGLIGLKIHLLKILNDYDLYQLLTMGKSELNEAEIGILKLKFNQIRESVNVEILEDILLNPHIDNNYKYYQIENFEDLNDSTLDEYINLFNNSKFNDDLKLYFIHYHKFDRELNNNSELELLENYIDNESIQIKKETIKKIKSLLLDKENLLENEKYLLNYALEKEAELK